MPTIHVDILSCPDCGGDDMNVGFDISSMTLVGKCLQCGLTFKLATLTEPPVGWTEVKGN